MLFSQFSSSVSVSIPIDVPGGTLSLNMYLRIFIYIYTASEKMKKKKESVRIDAKKILQDFIFQFFFQRSSCSRVYSNCTELYLVQIVARN